MLGGRNVVTAVLVECAPFVLGLGERPPVHVHQRLDLLVAHAGVDLRQLLLAVVLGQLHGRI